MAQGNTDLVLETAPKPEDVQALGDRLYAFNVEKTGIGDGELFAFFLRDAAGVVTGGAYGWSWGGICSVRNLFVPEALRRQGLGRRLMAEIERIARSRDCARIVLETHDFQAPGFYEKLGFVVTGEIGDFPRGHRFIMLEKRLAGDGGRG
jgi:ribosomal protein S18 acetylase RimI-like enzyme